MNYYIVHTAIKCSDGKIHRLSYDLTEQTEGSVKEFGRVFAEIEKRFPEVNFWIEQYPENKEDLDDMNKYVSIHHPDAYKTPSDHYKKTTENKDSE